jgi:hypothetical protein
MQNLGKGSIEAIQLLKSRGAAKVSARKIAANRQNARKSTGPKTLRGKEFSRRNAVTHGLFAGDSVDFGAHREHPVEYEELLSGLRDTYEPVGRAEELEVERIAQGWRRLKRASRHENAMNRVALRTLGSKELQEKAELCKILEEQEKATVLLLQSFEEIELSDEIVQDLKQRIFAATPHLEATWAFLEHLAEATLSGPRFSKIWPLLDATERDFTVLRVTATLAVCAIEQYAKTRRDSLSETAVAQHIIPKGECLDRLLRYETTIDRSVTRALDRLERLQSRRREESLLPKRSSRLGP